jgi:hypothetical protein
MSETPSDRAPAKASISKRAVVELRYQLIAAIYWAALQAYNSPDKQISIFISQFSGAFFFLSFFTGQFFRIKYQQNLFSRFDQLENKLGLIPGHSRFKNL